MCKCFNYKWIEIYRVLYTQFPIATTSGGYNCIASKRRSRAIIAAAKEGLPDVP